MTHQNNTLVSFNSKDLTMSSREIAELTGKTHGNVKRVMESLLDESVINFYQNDKKSVGRGRPSIIYHVSKRDSYVVVAQLSPKFTGRLVDRWQELEEHVSLDHKTPALPQMDAQIKILESFGKITNMSETSLIRAYSIIGASNGVDTKFLPSYTDEKLTRSLSELLKLSGSDLSATKANKILLDLCYLQKLTRPGTGKSVKEFWSITASGLRYGKNETSVQNDKETQPRWYEETFGELLSLINQQKAA
jgi:phage regulator Rha-like protein